MIQRKRYTRASDLKVDEKTIEGYAARYNSMSVWLPSEKYFEVILPGAFTESLEDDDIRALYNHNDDLVLGRTKSGTLRLVETDEGIYFSCDLPETDYARNLAALLQRGDIDGCSIGFLCTEEDQDHFYDDENRPVCEVRKARLVEVTLGCTFPAYEDTSISLRSYERWKAQTLDEVAARKKIVDHLTVFLNTVDI